MARPLKMAVLLLSVYPLSDQCLLPLHPTHSTDVPVNLPHVPAIDWSYQRGSKEQAPL